MPKIKTVTQENDAYIRRSSSCLKFPEPWLVKQSLAFDAEMMRQDTLIQRHRDPDDSDRKHPSKEQIEEMSESEFALHRTWAKQQMSRMKAL